LCKAKPVGARWLQKLQRAGVCLNCSAPVPASAQALWLMNRGVYCEPCGAAFEAAGNPVKGRRKLSPPGEAV
jgi:predicted amidophosphoribosyltransferase